MSGKPLEARTVQAREKFLAAFAKCGTIKAAAALAGLDRRTVHRWLKDDPDFAAKLNETKADLVDHLTGKLWEIANDDEHRQQQLVACFGLLKNLDPNGWQDNLRVAVRDETPSLHLAVVALIAQHKGNHDRQGIIEGDTERPEPPRVESLEVIAPVQDPDQEPRAGEPGA